jgi:pantoate--beta-alanine ligase|tara:strand:+ start:579 stop:1370 length:792 start_codon:yes stop_codon:yes gene_type:complete
MHRWETVEACQSWRARIASTNESVGFVATMGALHPGHAALIEAAKAESDRVVVSIFVNPTQFNDASDFEKYPNTLAEDLELCRELGVDGVLRPHRAALYADEYRFRVTEDQVSTAYEGEHRPGHFDGVLTVVLKLLQIVAPQRAYFGEKDWQQLSLIRDMVEAFYMPMKIVPVPTVRETDGLALSSRNRRLSQAGREQARAFPQILTQAESPEAAVAELAAAGFQVDYVAESDGRRLGAVFVEGVRLIDNWDLSEIRQPAPML